MRKVPTKTPRRNKSRIAPGPLDIGTLRSCEGPTVFQLSLDPARLSFYCGFCKRIHEWVREFKEMECQMAWSRRLSELRFDPNRLPEVAIFSLLCGPVRGLVGHDIQADWDCGCFKSSPN